MGSEIGIMAGKSPVTADEEQRSALITLSRSRDRGEADRARAIVLTLSGWTSSQIAEAFGVREDTVRFWRGAFMTGGLEALEKSIAPGPAPVKAERALVVAEEVLSCPVADRSNWTLPRLADEIEKRSGVRISRSRLSRCCAKRGFSLATSPPHVEGPARRRSADPGAGSGGQGGHARRPQLDAARAGRLHQPNQAQHGFHRAAGGARP